ncbi:cytochrome P450 [Sphingomonas profundi]|uniref:cytochrome P450 n=1 Tax=Alterirhizorhabdus profundi TaxID=2681549 RepID=UPI0012E87FB0|nr:cytochrome P450 [Sphingomonas profundi]
MTGDKGGTCPIRLAARESYVPRVPHEVFKELRASSPVSWHEADGYPGFWAITKYRDIVSISTDTRSFSSARGVFVEDIESGQGIPGSLLTSDPPLHTSLRAQLSDWFTATSLARLEGWLRITARAIMDRAASAGRCEFVYDMAAELPLLTICEFLGVPEADRSYMLALGDAVVRSENDRTFAEAMKKIGDYGLQLARQSAGDGGSGLVRNMLRSFEKEERLAEVEFAGQFAQLLVAGNETTRTLLSNIMLELCDRPDLHVALKAEPGRLPLAIEEFLRWTSPIYYMRRTAREDTKIGEVAIRAGDPVVMYYVSANRDEDVFDEPDTIDIDRRPNRHLAFGVGRHNCLGAQLARLETRIFMEEFLERFRSVSLDGAPVRFPSNVVNSWERLPVVLEVG